MSAEEVGAYIRLLCYQWEQGAIPEDPASLKRISGINPKKLGKILEKFQKTDHGLKNFRMEEVRSSKEKFLKIQSENGKKGGRPRGKTEDSVTEEETHGFDLGFDSETQPQSETEPEKTLPSPFLPLPLPIGTITLNAEAPCTVEEAWSYANGSGVGITREGVELWHAKNSDAGWMVFPAHGPARAVTDWRARLRGSVAWIREELAKAQAAESRIQARGSRPGYSPPQKPRPNYQPRDPEHLKEEVDPAMLAMAEKLRTRTVQELKDEHFAPNPANQPDFDF